MTEVPRELRDEIPSFEEARPRDHGLIDWTALTSIRTAKSALEIGTIILIAAAVFFGLEGILRWTGEPQYVIPRPISVVKALGTNFGVNYGHHLWVTMQEFLMGLAIG